MTNTIVLLSVLLQTNWADTTIAHDGLMIQVGRRQTNYVVKPALGPVVIPRGVDFRAYPILTSQPFYGPYNLIREVPAKYITVGTNEWPQWIIPRGIILTNREGTEWKFPFPSTEVFTNSPPRMPPGL